jgi:hypothetical protein
MYNWAKQMVMTDKLLHSSHVSQVLPVNTLWDQMDRSVMKWQVLNIRSVCVSVFLPSSCSMQITSFLHHITLSPVACPALPYFSTLTLMAWLSEKKNSDHKMCVLIFFTIFICNTSYSTKNSAQYYHKCS